jgi:hypothetical protein
MGREVATVQRSPRVKERREKSDLEDGIGLKCKNIERKYYI